MDIHSLLIFQIVADVVLCVAILLLLKIINKNIRQQKFNPEDQSVIEFRKLLEESQVFGTHFLQALEDGREVLKEISKTVDQKEKELKTLIKDVEQKITMLEKGRQEKMPADPDKQYRDIVNMAKDGLDYQEISRISGLTAGEIELIVDLEQKKDKGFNSKTEAM